MASITALPPVGFRPDIAPSRGGDVRVAVIDGDAAVVRVLANRFEARDWHHRTAGASVPPSELVSMRVNALVVDLGVLGPGAWDYLDEVCVALPELAVLVCTGRSSVAQRVRGLRMGADDWITKPCHPEEVVARVEAALRRRRRHGGSQVPAGVSAGELEIRPQLYQAFVGKTGAELTRREFEVLQVLADAAGQVIERDDLYQRVWGYAMAHGDRSVDVFVRKVRQKLERLSPDWTYIHTHFGIGYRFEAEPKTSTS